MGIVPRLLALATLPIKILASQIQKESLPATLPSPRYFSDLPTTVAFQFAAPLPPVFLASSSSSPLTIFTIAGQPMQSLFTGEPLSAPVPSLPDAITLYNSPFFTQQLYRLTLADSWVTLSLIDRQPFMPNQQVIIGLQANSTSYDILLLKSSTGQYSIVKRLSKDPQSTTVDSLQGIVSYNDRCKLVQNADFVIHNCESGKLSIIQKDGWLLIDKTFSAPSAITSFAPTLTSLYFAVRDTGSVRYCVVQDLFPPTAASVSWECKLTIATSLIPTIMYFPTPQLLLMFHGADYPIEKSINFLAYEKDLTTVAMTVTALSTDTGLPDYALLPTGLISRSAKYADKAYISFYSKRNTTGYIFNTMSFVNTSDIVCSYWGEYANCSKCIQSYYLYEQSRGRHCFSLEEIPLGFGVNRKDNKLYRCMGCDFCPKDYTCPKELVQIGARIISIGFNRLMQRIEIEFDNSIDPGLADQTEFTISVLIDGKQCFDCMNGIARKVSPDRYTLEVYPIFLKTIYDGQLLITLSNFYYDITYADGKDFKRNRPVPFNPEQARRLLASSLDTPVKYLNFTLPGIYYYHDRKYTKTSGIYWMLGLALKLWHVVFLKMFMFKTSERWTVTFHEVLSYMAPLRLITSSFIVTPDTFLTEISDNSYLGFLRRSTVIDDQNFKCGLPKTLVSNDIACSIVEMYLTNIIIICVCFAGFLIFGTLRNFCYRGYLMPEPREKHRWIKEIFRRAFTFEYLAAVIYGAGFEILSYSFMNYYYYYKSPTMNGSLAVSILFTLFLVVIMGIMVRAFYEQRELNLTESTADFPFCLRFTLTYLKPIFYRYFSIKNSRISIGLLINIFRVILISLLSVLLMSDVKIQVYLMFFAEVILFILSMCTFPNTERVGFCINVLMSMMYPLYLLTKVISLSTGDESKKQNTWGYFMVSPLIGLVGMAFIGTTWDIGFLGKAKSSEVMHMARSPVLSSGGKEPMKKSHKQSDTGVPQLSVESELNKEGGEDCNRPPGNNHTTMLMELSSRIPVDSHPDISTMQPHRHTDTIDREALKLAYKERARERREQALKNEEVATAPGKKPEILSMREPLRLPPVDLAPYRYRLRHKKDAREGKDMTRDKEANDISEN